MREEKTKSNPPKPETASPHTQETTDDPDDHLESEPALNRGSISRVDIGPTLVASSEISHSSASAPSEAGHRESAKLRSLSTSSQPDEVGLGQVPGARSSARASYSGSDQLAVATEPHKTAIHSGGGEVPPQAQNIIQDADRNATTVDEDDADSEEDDIEDVEDVDDDDEKDEDYVEEEDNSIELSYDPEPPLTDKGNQPPHMLSGVISPIVQDRKGGYGYPASRVPDIGPLGGQPYQHAAMSAGRAGSYDRDYSGRIATHLETPPMINAHYFEQHGRQYQLQDVPRHASDPLQRHPTPGSAFAGGEFPGPLMDNASIVYRGAIPRMPLQAQRPERAARPYTENLEGPDVSRGSYGVDWTPASRHKAGGKRSIVPSDTGRETKAHKRRRSRAREAQRRLNRTEDPPHSGGGQIMQGPGPWNPYLEAGYAEHLAAGGHRGIPKYPPAMGYIPQHRGEVGPSSDFSNPPQSRSAIVAGSPLHPAPPPPWKNQYDHIGYYPVPLHGMAMMPVNPPYTSSGQYQQSPIQLGSSRGESGKSSGLPPIVGQPSSHFEAQLEIEGKLWDMTRDWTAQESKSGRRLVRFIRSQRGVTVILSFHALDGANYREDMHVVSCIWRRETQQYFITSVDCISLLELIFNQRFSVEEKNRIRRNLEGSKPLTVTKSKPNLERFFRQIMSFDVPRPRNIEKDVKVFLWQELENALNKIVSKYSASWPMSDNNG